MSFKYKTATGFVIRHADSESLYAMIISAIELYKNPKLWLQLCKTAMRQDVGWDASAREYQKLYQIEVDARK
jgi:starch synthase